MAIGFKTYTPDGLEQLNSNVPNMRIIAYGTAPANPTGGNIQIPNLFPESPMVLIKPQPGVSVGGVMCFQGNEYQGNSIRYQSNGSFQWALCSTIGTPVSVGLGKVGLKIWSESGELIFSPQYKYPRITGIISISSPPYQQSATSRSIGFAQQTKMPWFIAQDAAWSYDGDAGYAPFCYAIRVNSALNTLTVEIRDTDGFDPNGYRVSNDVFAGRLMRFPMCDIPGL